MIIDPLGNIPIERGGTGATTIEEVKANLGLADTGLSNVTNQTFANKATNAGVAGETWESLYGSSSGTTGTITLNDSISNYVRVKICYKDNNNNCIERIFRVGMSRYTIDLCVVYANMGTIGSRYLKISGTTATQQTDTKVIKFLDDITNFEDNSSMLLKVCYIYGCKTY